MTAAIWLALTKRCGLRGCNITRANAVTLDIVFTKLRTNITSKHFQSTFGGGIGTDGLATKFTHHRTDIDNLAMSLLLHIWNNGFRYNKRSIQVYVHNLTEVLYRHLFHRNTLDDTSIIYKNINGSKFLFNLCNHFFHIFLFSAITNITFHINTFSLIVSQGLVQMLLTTTIKCNLSACLSISLCDGKANTIGCSGYQSDLSFQRKIL